MERNGQAGIGFERWRITATAAAVIAAAALGAAFGLRDHEQGLRAALRITARSSALLFGLAFTASAAERLWPCPFTRWQRRNRRHLGLAFAASHTIHALAIAALAVAYPLTLAAHVRERGSLGGTIGYGFIALLAATSFDRSAAWMGTRAWKLLHQLGMFYVWLAFFSAFLSRALHEPAYWAPVGLALLALGLRATGWFGRRSQVRPA
jgi:methionine sulfoxide reductase heme-binding subunit